MTSDSYRRPLTVLLWNGLAIHSAAVGFYGSIAPGIFLLAQATERRVKDFRELVQRSVIMDTKRQASHPGMN